METTGGILFSQGDIGDLNAGVGEPRGDDAELSGTFPNKGGV
jgi:hypothetical protein